MINITTAIRQGTSSLNKKSIKSSQLDSEILLAKVLHRDRKYILLNPNNLINNENLASYRKLIEERSKRRPIAQIINKKYFWNSEFFVSKHTLIPRPDTELIVENVLRLTKYKKTLKILDIGTGSGCILISILQERKNFYGTGIDVSKNCLKLTKLNAINLNVNKRLKLYKSNVDKFSLGKYDLIVSNPPYINKFKIKYLDRDIANYEPKLALDGGVDGLSEIKKVIKKSSELIKRNGKFILEIGFDQKNRVINILKEEGFYINTVQKDLAKKDRCIVSTKIK